MAEQHHSMTTCDLKSLLPNVLAHTPAHIRAPKAQGYIKCRKKHGLKAAPCAKRVKFAEHGIRQCGKTLETSIAQRCPEKIACAKYKYQDQSYKLHKYAVPEDACEFTEEEMTTFNKHTQCLNEAKTDIERLCLSSLTEKCTRSKLVAYKALRISMEAVGSILERDPDTYVIYLVRDPRAIVMSTVGAKLLGTAARANHNSTLEARFLCTKMKRDLELYSSYSQLYPGAIKLVKYEDLVRKPEYTAEDIYRHFNVPLNPAVPRWIASARGAQSEGDIYSTDRSDWTASINKWRRLASVATTTGMNRHCYDVLNILGYSTE